MVGPAWQGVYMAGGMHGRGRHLWQGVRSGGHAWQRVCTAGDTVHSGIVVYGGGDIVFGANRSNQWMQWTQWMQ